MLTVWFPVLATLPQTDVYKRQVLHYGLITERMAALYTDALRAEMLEQQGYRTQILEFIDMEHTPKNILLRAVYEGKPKHNEKEIQQILEFL